MPLTRDDVEKTALLARLQLTADELASMTAQLAEIVNYVDQLAEVDDDEAPPMVHAIEVCNVLADDCVAPSLPRDAALANAPRENGRGYLVPAVLGE